MTSDTTRARFAAFAAQLEASPPRDRWLVLTHDNPDPDALASAAALALVLRRRFKRRVTVAYGGMIGRAENREMVRALRLELSHLQHLKRADYRRFALVDCQPWTGNSQLPKEVVPDLVFDHHPLRKATLAARFVDVRPRYGATATILAEYLEESGLEPPPGLATAMVYAIRSETQEFGREAAGPDHAAFDRLLPRMRPPRAVAHPVRAAAADLLPQPPPRARGARRRRQPGGLQSRQGGPARHRARDRRPAAAHGGARPGRCAPASTATGSTCRSGPRIRAPTPAS